MHHKWFAMLLSSIKDKGENNLDPLMLINFIFSVNLNFYYLFKRHLYLNVFKVFTNDNLILVMIYIFHIDILEELILSLKKQLGGQPKS